MPNRNWENFEFSDGREFSDVQSQGRYLIPPNPLQFTVLVIDYIPEPQLGLDRPHRLRVVFHRCQRMQKWIVAEGYQSSYESQVFLFFISDCFNFQATSSWLFFFVKPSEANFYIFESVRFLFLPHVIDFVVNNKDFLFISSLNFVFYAGLAQYLS